MTDDEQATSSAMDPVAEARSSGSADAAHDAETSGGTPGEVAPGQGSPGAGTVDGTDHADMLDGVLSPGSTATSGPTESADSPDEV